MGARGLRGSLLRGSLVVWGAVAVSVGVRLPLLELPAWPDEAGLLMVGRQWHLGASAGDRSLYDAHWVDRPPLLITAYALAERLAGLQALRVLGALAAAMTVAGVAHVANSIAGGRAAAWAAVTMAAFVSTPFHWSFMVDAELVAAPFVAAGLALVTRGVSTDGPRGLLHSCGGGAVACAAVLTKQNLWDVVIYAGSLTLLMLLSRSMAAGALARHALAFLAGALAVGAAVGAWTLAHGTQLDEVAYAMYAFRVDAAVVRAQAGSAVSWDRLEDLGVAACLSGLAVLAVVTIAAGLRHRPRDMRVLALMSVLAFDLVSVVAGTSYWLHYLTQPAVPVAALAGVLAAKGTAARIGSLVAVLMALIGWIVLLRSPPQTAEELVGEAIAEVAEPGDSVVTVPGHSNVTYATGLRSPYEHLWALPARTLDPGGRGLQALLNGPRAPTWVVFWRVRPDPVMPGAVGFAVADNYRASTRICGLWIYVHKTVERPRPVPRPRPAASRRTQCESVTALPHLLRELS